MLCVDGNGGLEYMCRGEYLSYMCVEGVDVMKVREVEMRDMLAADLSKEARTHLILDLRVTLSDIHPCISTSLFVTRLHLPIAYFL